jgi:hypothetical protein
MGARAVGKRYVSWDDVQQELYVRCLPNARSVLIDPDAKEMAALDMQYGFLFASYPKTVYEKKWKDADVENFPSYGNFSWGDENNIQIAECWRLIPKPCKLYIVGTQESTLKIFSDEIPEGYEISNGGITLFGQTIPILAERDTERPKVVQYLMNGRQLLEKPIDWEGKHIPIVPVFGRQYWIEEGGRSKRIVESIIRKARDGQLLHNYIKTAEYEAIGRILKSTHMAWDKTVMKYQKEWAAANKAPLPFLPLDSTAVGPNGELLPMPQPMIAPELSNISGYEMAD